MHTTHQSQAFATPRYTRTAMMLHWLLGVALVILFGVGLYMADLPFSPQRLKLYNWHKWAGVSILVLSVLRLLWRLTHRPPQLPASVEQAMPRWQQRAHHGAHHLLYLLFFAVPLLGWAYSSAAGFPIVFLGLWQLPDFVAATPEVNLLIETKKAGDLQTDEVQVKARAAVQWCDHANAYAKQHGARQWRYLLIPHDAVAVNVTLTKLAATY